MSTIVVLIGSSGNLHILRNIMVKEKEVRHSRDNMLHYQESEFLLPRMRKWETMTWRGELQLLLHQVFRALQGKPMVQTLQNWKHKMGLPSQITAIKVY
uniref:Mitogen-activated protein kinase 9 isoform X2 n=1 Tax=Rhizophora mucronata TaxID=61149 RepID=A0A2P2LFW5_RHIMU